MLLRYGRCLDYYFKCNRLGHSTRDCTEALNEATSEANLRLNVWLCTVIPPKRSQRVEKKSDGVFKSSRKCHSSFGVDFEVDDWKKKRVEALLDQDNSKEIVTSFNPPLLDVGTNAIILSAIPDRNCNDGSSIANASNVQKGRFIGWPVSTGPSITMKMFGWNARGLGSSRTFNTMHFHKQESIAELMFLMKTKCKLIVDSVGKSGGLCMMWDNSIIVDLLSYSPGHIEVRIQDNRNRVWRFTGFFSNPVQAQRLKSWILLRRLAGLYNLLWVVLGDFNEILCDSEKFGGSNKNWRDMAMFREAIDDSELEDMVFVRAKFT
ncbi:hypothetical protein Ddye_004995 [Dipteronia dyeriana]|uniref:CCHC-type domain-containing protein n=1 Tax=Dipteronia dyeriana TaxID=168575 RepID=A0AAD9XFQ3_9ROSI|nr:hypothetical protein Ddye_004995 [Dipteronia dyeriana]